MATQPASAQTEPTAGSATFVVMLSGSRVGTEEVTLSRSAAGWQLSSTGQLVAPFNLITNRFEVNYALDWQPRDLTIQAEVRGDVLSLQTQFGLTTATSDLVQADQRGSTTQQVSARTVVLPSNFFAGYEALAVRLTRSEVGARIPVFLAPSEEINAIVNSVTTRAISAPAGDYQIRQYDVTFSTRSGPLAVEIWADQHQRLARVVIPAAGLVVLREDLSSVMAREEKVRNPTDEDVLIPANGFNLAGTFTAPTVPADKPPVVILVPPPGPLDRDYAPYGVPIFGQLSGALADAGFFVVRFDQRGVGQSGGRVESAGLDVYTDDVRRVVSWARRRDDVDRDTFFIISHDQGAPVALDVTDREGRVRGVALLSAPGRNGVDMTLERQARELTASNQTAIEQETRLALQRRIINAVITGEGWEAVPEQVRRQADNAWFRSWLLFEPAAAVEEVDEPILILHGSLDQEIDPVNADRLEQLGRRRDEPDAYTQKTIVPGVNHLLVTATTGAVDEYDTLESPTVAPAVIAAIVDWLRATLAARRR